MKQFSEILCSIISQLMVLVFNVFNWGNFLLAIRGTCPSSEWDIGHFMDEVLVLGLWLRVVWYRFGTGGF